MVVHIFKLSTQKAEASVFKTNQVYKVSSRTARAITPKNPVWKKKNEVFFWVYSNYGSPLPFLS